MKKAIFSLAIMMMLAGSLLVACQSYSKKEEASQRKIEQSKLDLKATRDRNNTEQQRIRDEALRVEHQQEWIVFKNESEAKIDANQTRITELKAEMRKPGKKYDTRYARKIDNLEQRNLELRMRINTYNDEQSDWNTFKNEFNHDLNEIGLAFTNLTVNSKK
jgi:hypothetical protein